MSILVKILLILHVAGGITTLISGPIAIFFNWNNTKAHRTAGKVFFIAMLVVCFSSMLTFARHPEKIFYQFLFGLSFVVLAQLVQGVRAIFLMKRQPVSTLDYALSLLSLLSGAGMAGMSIYLMNKPNLMAFAILFGVFGTGAIFDGIKWWKHIAEGDRIEPLTWLRLHTSAMIGSFIASTTAFTVNVAHFLPWYAQWFGPTILLVPISIYFGKKIRSKSKKIVSQPVVD